MHIFVALLRPTTNDPEVVEAALRWIIAKLQEHQTTQVQHQHTYEEEGGGGKGRASGDDNANAAALSAPFKQVLALLLHPKIALRLAVVASSKSGGGGGGGHSDPTLSRVAQLARLVLECVGLLSLHDTDGIKLQCVDARPPRHT